MDVKKLKTTSDLLLHKGKKIAVILDDYRYDEGSLKVVGEKKAPIVIIPVDRIINSKGIARARLLSRLRSFLKPCVKYGVYYALGIVDKNTKREDSELAAIGVMLGLNTGQAMMSIKRFKEIKEKKD